jgi:chorismate mutase / prephenate dehydratase
MSNLSPLKICYKGLIGSFSYITALKFLEKISRPLEEVELIGCDSFSNILERLSLGETDLSIVPLENSIAGTIHEVYDLLLNYDFKILEELYSPVNHNLLGLDSVELDLIKCVYSHPMALKQCHDFFSINKNIKAIADISTSHACRRVLQEGEVQNAAIGSEDSAEIYGLKIIKDNIQDTEENSTRFVVLARSDYGFFDYLSNCSSIKCTLILQIKHEPGSLYEILKVLKDDNCNLLKIESRPIPKEVFAYNFYLDFNLGKTGKDIINLIAAKSRSLKNLGFYPYRDPNNDFLKL